MEILDRQHTEYQRFFLLTKGNKGTGLGNKWVLKANKRTNAKNDTIFLREEYPAQSGPCRIEKMYRILLNLPAPIFPYTF